MVTETNTDWLDTEARRVRAAFGNVVERRREAKGMSQRSFARVAGISCSHLRSIEEGKVSPTLVTVWKISGVLEVEAEALVVETRELASNRQALKKRLELAQRRKDAGEPREDAD